MKKTDQPSRLDKKARSSRGKNRFTRELGMTPMKINKNVASMDRIIRAMKATFDENKRRAKYQDVSNAAGYKMICSTLAPSTTWSASLLKKAIKIWSRGGYK
jgi:hypothetical protein